MACRVELINTKKNKIEQILILDSTYKECEVRVLEMNDKLHKKTSDK